MVQDCLEGCGVHRHMRSMEELKRKYKLPYLFQVYLDNNPKPGEGRMDGMDVVDDEGGGGQFENQKLIHGMEDGNTAMETEGGTSRQVASTY